MVKLADRDDSYGLVIKGGSLEPRFAIPFRDNTRLADFARANHIEDQSNLQRCKISGIGAAVGLHGLFSFLGGKGWKCAEILYLAEGSGVFLSENTGSTAKVFCSHDGVRRQLKFKALNASARVGAKGENQLASSSASVIRRDLCVDGQKSFLQKVGSHPKQPPPAGPKAPVDFTSLHCT